MRKSPPNKPLLIALYLNAALLAVIALLLLGNRGGASNLLPAALAQNQLPIGGGAGVFIVPAQFSLNTYGCYMIDVDAQTIWAYHYYPADKTLRLAAARTYRHDRRLERFNTNTPSPEEVRKLLEQQQDPPRGRERNADENDSPSTRSGE